MILDRAGITVNKNAIPNDPLPPSETSGIRLGTPAVSSQCPEARRQAGPFLFAGDEVFEPGPGSVFNPGRAFFLGVLFLLQASGNKTGCAKFRTASVPAAGLPGGGPDFGRGAFAVEDDGAR